MIQNVQVTKIGKKQKEPQNVKCQLCFYKC